MGETVTPLHSVVSGVRTTVGETVTPLHTRHLPLRRSAAAVEHYQMLSLCFLPKSFCRTCPSYRSSARSLTMILSPTSTSLIQSINTWTQKYKHHSQKLEQLYTRCVKKTHSFFIPFSFFVNMNFEPLTSSLGQELRTNVTATPASAFS